MGSYKNSISIEEIEPRLNRQGIKTRGLTDVQGHPGEFFLWLVTPSDFHRASRWCEAMAPRFRGFKIYCCQSEQA